MSRLTNSCSFVVILKQPFSFRFCEFESAIQVLVLSLLDTAHVPKLLTTKLVREEKNELCILQSKEPP